MTAAGALVSSRLDGDFQRRRFFCRYGCREVNRFGAQAWGGLAVVGDEMLPVQKHVLVGLGFPGGGLKHGKVLTQVRRVLVALLCLGHGHPLQVGLQGGIGTEVKGEQLFEIRLSEVQGFLDRVLPFLGDVDPLEIFFPLGERFHPFNVSFRNRAVGVFVEPHRAIPFKTIWLGEADASSKKVL